MSYAQKVCLFFAFVSAMGFGVGTFTLLVMEEEKSFIVMLFFGVLMGVALSGVFQ